jgi:hypothetical protein
VRRLFFLLSFLAILTPPNAILQVPRLSGSWCSLVSGLGALVYKSAAENVSSPLGNALVRAGTKLFPEDMADYCQDSLDPGNLEKKKMRQNKKARSG